MAANNFIFDLITFGEIHYANGLTIGSPYHLLWEVEKENKCRKKEKNISCGSLFTGDGLGVWCWLRVASNGNMVWKKPRKIVLLTTSFYIKTPKGIITTFGWLKLAMNLFFFGDWQFTRCCVAVVDGAPVDGWMEVGDDEKFEANEK